MTTTRYCSTCGTLLPENAAVCGECGARYQASPYERRATDAPGAWSAAPRARSRDLGPQDEAAAGDDGIELISREDLEPKQPGATTLRPPGQYDREMVTQPPQNPTSGPSAYGSPSGSGSAAPAPAPQGSAAPAMEPPLDGCAPSTPVQRLVAALIDGVVAGLVTVPMTIGIILLATQDSATLLAQILVGVGSVLPLVHALVMVWLTGAKGFTVGKLVMGLRIARHSTGGSLGFLRALGRWVVFGVISPVMALSIFLDPLKRLRGFHDRAVDSVVVDVKHGRNPLTARADDFERAPAEQYLGAPSVAVSAHENLLSEPGAAWGNDGQAAQGAPAPQPGGWDAQPAPSPYAPPSAPSATDAPAPQEQSTEGWGAPAPAPQEQNTGGWGSPAPASQAQDAGGWAPPPVEPVAQPGWDQPQAPEQQGWGQPPAAEQQPGWGQPPAAEQQPAWGAAPAQPSAPEPQWGPPPAAPAAQSWDQPPAAQQPAAPEQPAPPAQQPATTSWEPPAPTPAAAHGAPQELTGDAWDGGADEVDEATRMSAPEDDPLGDLEATRISPVKLPPKRTLRLVTDAGTERVVDRAVVIGRNPTAPAGELLFVLQDDTRSVSKTHLLVDGTGEETTVTDLGSTNGSAIVREDGSRESLVPNSPTVLPAGARVALGDRTLSVEREQ